MEAGVPEGGAPEGHGALPHLDSRKPPAASASTEKSPMALPPFMSSPFPQKHSLAAISRDFGQ